MATLRYAIALCLFFIGPVKCFAQTTTEADIEKDLLQANAAIFPFYYINVDSQTLYSDIFEDKFINYVAKNPATLGYRFDSLVQHGCCSIVTSDDGLFRIYSWDLMEGGTMHFFQNIYQFKSGNKVFAKTFERGEGDPFGYYSEIFTLRANNKCYYLAIENAIGSSIDVSQSVRVFTIENDTLNSTVNLIKTKSGLSNGIDVGFDFFSVSNHRERPLKLIKYDPDKKILYIPTVTDDYKITGKFVQYQFTGKYFEEMPRAK